MNINERNLIQDLHMSAIERWKAASCNDGYEWKRSAYAADQEFLDALYAVELDSHDPPA